MDWQKYVDEQLMCEIDGHRLTSVAIIGHDGKIWGKSSSFPEFKSEEITSIMNDFAEPGSLAPTGFYFGSTKYMVIQGEPGFLIRGNKRSGGIIIKKTRLALIVGIHNEPMKLSQCNSVIEKMGAYLLDQGM